MRLIQSPLRSNRGASARGQAQAAQDSARTCSKVRGTSTANSCGGANWQSSKQAPQSWQRFAR